MSDYVEKLPLNRNSLKSKTSEAELLPSVKTTARNFNTTETGDYPKFTHEDDLAL